MGRGLIGGAIVTSSDIGYEGVCMYCSDLQFCLECIDQSLLPGEETLCSECITLYASHVTVN